MISDIALLKPLPDFILDSVQAYVGCLSGAIMKEEYLDAIKDAGFQKVRILQEKRFPLELMANDPTAKAIVNELNISEKDLKGLSRSVVSITVEGKKTKI